MDTAKAIDPLDLVVTVDTATGHLAGAMGKPTLLMLAKHADWRWFENRDDSPWYPSMRLLRQPAAGEWGPVLERVEAELGRLSGR